MADAHVEVIMDLEIKATVLGSVAALGALGLAFGLSSLAEAQKVEQEQQAAPPSVTSSVAPAGEVMRGHELFDHNCAHCHGDDARGNEGPSLYNLAKTDARITSIIKGGIKGEMPAFGNKFNDADVQALISYVRTLKG
jgi:cbb3-type cytochrome c oxidase subunit III